VHRFAPVEQQAAQICPQPRNLGVARLVLTHLRQIAPAELLVEPLHNALESLAGRGLQQPDAALEVGRQVSADVDLALPVGDRPQHSPGFSRQTERPSCFVDYAARGLPCPPDCGLHHQPWLALIRQGDIIADTPIRGGKLMAWDSERDAALVELHSQGLSFRQISTRLGVTRNAALGRYQRVVRKKFPSESAKARSELRLERRAIAILNLRRDLAAGVEPQTAILRALGAGAGGGLIATELNVPPHRVYQLVAADRCEAAERRPAIK